MPEPGPALVVQEHRRDLREREDEDEVEEQLEGSDPMLALGALLAHEVRLTCPTYRDPGRNPIRCTSDGRAGGVRWRWDQTASDFLIQASISARDGGTAPLRVHVIAAAVTAYSTAPSSSESSSGRVAPGSSASRSTRAASSAAPKLSPAPTVSTTLIGTAGTRARPS